MKHKLRLFMCCLLISALVPMNYAFARISIDRDEDGINIDDIVYHLAQPGSLSNSEYIRNLMYQIAPINSLPTAAAVAEGITSVTAPAVEATSLILPSLPTGYSIGIFTSSNTGVVRTDNVIVPQAAATNVDLVFAVTRISDGSTANTGLITVTVPAHVLMTPTGEPVGYVYCANEGGTCNFPASARVAYGANYNYNYLTFMLGTTSTSCSNEVFGDPIGGTSKSCYYETTAAVVAAGITSVTPPAADVTSLTLPNVPTGYDIVILTSTGVIGTDGVIVPPSAATDVNLVFKVTKLSDGSTANTGTIVVNVPAASSITKGGTVTASGENAPYEGMEQAFDGMASTKWYVGTVTGWIQYQLLTPHIVTNYSITSANDSPGRDPKDWTLKGSNDGTNWTVLDTRADETFANRFQKNAYTFSNSTSYLYYRLDVSANHTAGEVQLAEIELLGTPAPAPAPPVIIDLSNGGTWGTSFGSTSNEVKRWQTFTANGNPNLTSVDVKIHKRAGSDHSGVTVELFATSNNKPTGSALATITISSGSVLTEYSIVNALLTYNGLISGNQYAIVLGQSTNSASNYEWINSGLNAATGQHNGKFDGNSIWTDESGLGNAWLKVNVN